MANLKDTLKLFHDPREVDQYFEQMSKIINIAQNNYHRTRDIIIDSDNISNNDKKKLLNMLDTAYKNTRQKKVPTSDYDDKPYTQFFFREFNRFISNNSLKMNELKIILSIYEILHESNTYGNILINASNKMLAERTGIAYSNINKDIKSLVNKNLLIKDENGSLFLNCKYFYRGTKTEYDVYNDLYTELETKPQQLTTNNNDNLELDLDVNDILLNNIFRDEEWTTTI